MVINFTLTGLGLLLYILMGLWKSKRSHKQDFNTLIWFQDNYISILIAIVSAVSLDLMIEPEITLLKLPDFIIAVYFANGYLNVSFVKKIFDIFRPKKLRK